MPKEVEKFSLKDELFNEPKVKYLASLFVHTEKKFDDKNFSKEVLEKFPELELKERIYHIRDVLKKHLDTITKGDYQKNLKIILQSLPAELDPSKSDDDFGDFIFAPLGYFVAIYGLDKKDLKKSLNALAEMTKRFSAEDTIRFFINAHPAEAFAFMQKMSLSKNYHQRRLASEGLRPKLPWAMKIDFDYKKGSTVLDNVYYDNTRYVTRSVANHLNDISKIDPDFVIQKLKQWKKENKQTQKEFEYITKHALRTLVKKGNKDALQLLGFSNNPKIQLQNFHLKEKNLYIEKMKNAVEKYDLIKKEGQSLEFSFEIYSDQKQNVLIDYNLHFQNKVGKTTEKTFKLKSISVNKGERMQINKKHPLRIMSTKKLYPGEHFLDIQINGKIYKTIAFKLI